MSENDQAYADIQKEAIPLLKRLVKLLEHKKPVAFILWLNEPSDAEGESTAVCCLGGTSPELLAVLANAEADSVLADLEESDEDADDGDIEDDIEDEGQA